MKLLLCCVSTTCCSARMTHFGDSKRPPPSLRTRSSPSNRHLPLSTEISFRSPEWPTESRKLASNSSLENVQRAGERNLSVVVDNQVLFAFLSVAVLQQTNPLKLRTTNNLKDLGKQSEDQIRHLVNITIRCYN